MTYTVTTTQHDLWLKAFGLLFNAQAKKAQKRSKHVTYEPIGNVHHINRCHSALTPEALAVWKAQKATTPEENAAIRPFLRPVSVYRMVRIPKGKMYENTGRREAARRLARTQK